MKTYDLARQEDDEHDDPCSDGVNCVLESGHEPPCREFRAEFGKSIAEANRVRTE